MSVHSSQRRKRKDPNRGKFRSLGKQEEFLSRITKTLYYGDSHLCNRLSLPVTELAAELYSEVKAGRSLERLRLEEAAEISRSTCASPCSFVLAMLYLERLKCCNPSYVDRAVPSELFIISMMVASKFLNDDGEEDEVLNSEWAESVGLSVKDINRLEKEFLSAIKWEVFVKDSAFWTYLRKLERDIAYKEGKRRGWFSYTELENLLDRLDSFTLTQALITMSAVCLASYTAGVLTVVGSTILVSHMPTAYMISRSPLWNYSNKSTSFNLKSSFDRDIESWNSCTSNNLVIGEPIKKESNQNWDLDLPTWLSEKTGGNESNEITSLSLNGNVELNYGMRMNSFLYMSNYLYSLSQHLKYMPLEIISSY